MTSPGVWTISGPGGSWASNPRLLPLSGSKALRGLGSFSFRLLRGTRRTASATTSNADPVVGHTIAVTSDGLTPTTSNVSWIGTIEEINRRPLMEAGSSDELGEVTALEIGHRWKRQTALRGWLRDVGYGAEFPVEIDPPPTANSKERGGKLIGNAYTYGGVQVFASDIDNASNEKWNAYGLLDHAVLFCTPGGDWTAYCDTSCDTFLSPITEEAFPVQDQTLGGLLDYLASEARCLTWWPVWNGNGFDIHVATLDPDETGADTAAVDIGTQLVDWQFRDRPPYDEVIVEGAHIVCCGTISGPEWSETMQMWWSSGAETYFRQGGTSTQTDPDKAKTYRNGNGYVADAFRRYRINPVSPYDYIGCVDSSDNEQSLCPQIDWNGTSATISTTVDRGPTMDAVRVLDWIPVYAESPTGLSLLDRDHLRKPLVFRRTDTAVFYDLLAPPKGWAKPQVEADDRGPAIRITYPYPETLAAGDWTSPGASHHSPTSLLTIDAGDWADLHITLAIESGQRLTVTKRRSGVAVGDVVRRVTCRRPDLQAWLVRAGTILSCVNAGAATRNATDYLFRNDYAQAEAMAVRIARAAFLEPSAAVLALSNPLSPPLWARLGAILTTVTVRDRNSTQLRVVDAYAAVREIAMDLSASSPRLTVSCDPMSVEAMASGLESVALAHGGSPAMSLRRSAEAVSTAGRDSVHSGASTPADDDALRGRRVRVDASHSFTVGNAIRYTASGWAKAKADALSTADVHGIVVAQGTGWFIYQRDGQIDGLTSLTAGSVYYLDASTAGAATATKPAIATPLYVALSTTTALLLIGDTDRAKQVLDVTQNTHGFSAKDAIYINTSGVWAKAKADAEDTARVHGLVVKVVDANNFQVLLPGQYAEGLSGLTAGNVYYLSSATAGALTTAMPFIWSVPVLWATSTTAGIFAPGEPELIAMSGGGAVSTGADGSITLDLTRPIAVHIHAAETPITYPTASTETGYEIDGDLILVPTSATACTVKGAFRRRKLSIQTTTHEGVNVVIDGNESTQVATVNTTVNNSTYTDVGVTASSVQVTVKIKLDTANSALLVCTSTGTDAVAATAYNIGP